MAWSCHYATGCFVAFLGDISILKSGWNMKNLFCCPALELFHCLPPLFSCLPLWTTVRLHGKKLQNVTKSFWMSERSWSVNILNLLWFYFWNSFKNYQAFYMHIAVCSMYTEKIFLKVYVNEYTWLIEHRKNFEIELARVSSRL